MITEVRFSAVATAGSRPRLASISLRSRAVTPPVGQRLTSGTDRSSLPLYLFFPPLLNHSLLASVFYLLCHFFPSRLTSVAPPAHGTGHLTCLTVIRFDRKQSPISEEIPPIHISPTAAISSSYLAPRLNTTGPSVRVDYLFSLWLFAVV